MMEVMGTFHNYGDAPKNVAALKCLGINRTVLEEAKSTY
jgi:hypothetical protein